MSKSRKIFYLGLLVIPVLSGLWHITDDLYGDEWGHTYKIIVSENFGESIIQLSPYYPPLYFAFARLSVLLLGSLWAIRIPSLLAAVALVAFAPWAAKHMLGRPFFFPAMGLAAVASFVMEFSAEGRAYAMMLALSLALFWAFTAFIRQETFPRAVILGLVAAAGVWTHYIFGLVLLSFGFIYVLKRRVLRRPALAAALIVIIFVIPLGMLRLSAPATDTASGLQSDWTRQYFSIPNFLGRLAIAFNFGYSTFQLPRLDPARNVGLKIISDNWVLILLVLIAFTGIGVAWLKAYPRWRELMTLAGGTVAITIGLSVMASLAGFFMIREKHLAIVWGPFFLLLLVAGDEIRRWKHGGRMVLACYLSVVMISNYHYLFQKNDYSRRMDWSGLIEALEREVSAKDVIVVYRSDIEALSLRREGTVLPDVPRYRVADELAQGRSLKSLAEKLHRMTTGKIFLVNNETDRLLVDPDSTIFTFLGEHRESKETRWGRNLIILQLE